MALQPESGIAMDHSQPVTTNMRSRPPIPIARVADGTVTAALTNAHVQAILDEDDIAKLHSYCSHLLGCG